MKLKSLLISIALVTLLACANQRSAAGRTLENDDDEKKVEQTIAVEPNVIVSLCIASGSITVHGWERNEVQARSKDAEAINFRRASASNAGPASRIEVLISDPADGPEGRTDSCNAFSDVELNVPRGAIVQLQTRDGDVTVSDVTEARVETQNGDIDLQRISETGRGEMPERRHLSLGFQRARPVGLCERFGRGRKRALADGGR